MADGYRVAGDCLVDEALSERHTRDVLVYPIVFCYRHFLELSLKCLISFYGPRLGTKPEWKSHDLRRLWLRFERLIDHLRPGESDDGTVAARQCIMEFAKVDPGSFSFRYAVSNKGQTLELPLDRIDLAQMKDVMAGLYGYFSGCDGFLDHVLNA
jgi:hypothetical protein